ncbi:flavin-containing monooxygenase 5-like [Ixodes scapularis]
MGLTKRLLPTCMNLEKPESRFNNYFSHEAYGLRPKNCVDSQRISLSDVLPSLILSGIVILKRNVVEFAGDGVLFENDKEVTKLDAVILATGYKIKFPMLSEDVVPAVDKQVQLYKHVFPPGLEHPTLAIIGLVKGAGSPLPLIELQARWVAQLLAGKCKLPPHPEMFHGIARERAPLRRRSGNSYDTSLHVDRMKYMDDLAEMIGASPRMLKYFFTDHKLFRALLGPCVTKLDAVILATGYKIKFPMLSEDVVPAVDKQVQLYKHVFPPGLEHPTLAIIGLVKGAGSPLPLIELQARWVAQLLAGKCKLPPHPEMFHGIARERAPLRRRSGNSYDTSLHVDRMKYMDDLAEMIGASPRMLKYFFTDHKLFRALLGPCVPYQFRLEGPHSWTGARDAVLGSQTRMLYPLNSNCTSFQTEKRGVSMFYILLSVIALFIAFFVYN